MNLDAYLVYGSVILGVVLALGAGLRARKAIDRWAFAIGFLALAAERYCSARLGRAISPEGMHHWELWQMSAGALIPATWLLFSLTFARGNAREFIRKWRPALLLTLLLPVGAVVFFRQDLILATYAIEGQAYQKYRLGTSGIVVYWIHLITAVLVLMNLERTFRASVGMVRWRIKFFLMGVGLLFLTRLYTASQTLLFNTVDASLDSLNSAGVLVAGGLILRSLFRAGHFNHDVYPSHTVLQGSLTVILAGLYLMTVGVFAKIVAYLGGDTSFALKALVVLVFVVGLAVLVQSDRVQLRIRRVVSRHFQRPLYDYRTVWRQFTEGTASHVELTDFTRAVTKLLAEIFQSLSVTVWLVDERREELTPAASTFITDAQAQTLPPTVEDAARVIRHMQSHPDPVDIEHLKDDWAVALRRCHPDVFHKGGTRVAIPIVANGEFLGVILLGDRVSGAAFTLQDLELLKSIGDQVASGLLNLRLSQRLLQAREHEAFQTMATFFVHDLKNAASTLNLMLQNLPDHFDDPDFREDALRGVGKSVSHINHVISRLTQLQHGLKINPTPVDLNTVVKGALDTFTSDKDFTIDFNPGILPPVCLDQGSDRQRGDQPGPKRP